MRIALFILGTVAVIYLMVKGFKQVLEESREQRTLDQDDTQTPQQLTQQRSQHSTHTEAQPRSKSDNDHNGSNSETEHRDQDEP